MSDSDPTASVHAAKPSWDSNGNPISAKVAATRQDLADQWSTVMCFITGVAALIAFGGFGYAFPSDVSFSNATEFNPVAGFMGAIAAVLALLPFIGIFAVLRVKET